MAKPSRRQLVFPAFLIILGSGWLFTVLGVLPGVNWLWILLIAAAGLAPMVIWGVDAATLPFGGLLLACTFASLLRQTGRLNPDVETPALVISAGVFMFAARLLPLTRPAWLIGKEPAAGPA